jgi:hypothetical protein
MKKVFNSLYTPIYMLTLPKVVFSPNASSGFYAMADGLKFLPIVLSESMNSDLRISRKKK